MRSLWTTGLLAIGLMTSLLTSPVRGDAPPVTSYARMTMQLQAEAAHCPWLRLASAGRSATGRRELWLARLADPAADPARTVRLLVLCRQHGDEPASTEAVLGLLRRITDGGDPALRAALKRVTLYVVPMANPDGADAGTRRNGAGADLNRDWGVFSQPETRALARAAAVIRPHLVVDAHNWDGGDHYDANCLEVTRAMTTPLGTAAHAMQQEAIAQLTVSGYRVSPTAYGAEADPRLAHRYFTRRGTLSCLVETHSGDPRDRADFQRRQGLYVALLHSLVRRAAGDGLAGRTRLERIEGAGFNAAREASLFPPRRIAPQSATASPLARHRMPVPVWVWALCLYGFALWAAGVGRRAPAAIPARGSATAPRPGFARASERRSAARPDRLRCRC